MVKNGAYVHRHGGRALKWSAHYSHFGVVEYLLENGANISALSEPQILKLIENNVIVNGTSSQMMQDAWDKSVQPIKENKNKVLGQVKVGAMSFFTET